MKNEPYVQQLLDAILLPDALTIIIRFQDIKNLTPWKLRESTLLTFLLRMVPLKA